MLKMNNGKSEMSPSPSAPPPVADDTTSAQFAARAPPPSYEESQMMCTPLPRIHPHLQQQQPPQPYPSNVQYPQPGTQYYPMPNVPYASGSAYQWQPPPPMQPQQYYQQPLTAPVAPVMATSTNSPVPGANSNPKFNNSPVLTLTKGAKIRTTSTGAVSIPPPPPGCAPTAAQYAAMQGQQVLVKKQKKSFF